MDIALVILTILGIALIIIAFTIDFENENNSYFILGFGLGILFTTLIMGIVYSLSIPPIDVYRGKTILEITYRDNIPIDSVVVYKNK